MNNGFILKGTLCPYFNRCLLAADGNCPQNIEVDFSCAMSRGFKIMDDREIVLQQSDDAAYEAWFKSTPEYWSVLTNEITAKTINSGGKDRFGCKGEIEKCGVSCCHKKDVHDCEKCSPHVAFECRPMCKKCVAKGRDTCRCK
jgi:hypothetical protein